MKREREMQAAYERSLVRAASDYILTGRQPENAALAEDMRTLLDVACGLSRKRSGDDLRGAVDMISGK